MDESIRSHLINRMARAAGMWVRGATTRLREASAGGGSTCPAEAATAKAGIQRICDRGATKPRDPTALRPGGLPLF